MATTSNYSWTTPDDTDLVKDGASAIRTLGSSADTTVKNLNPGTTAGDIDYYTSSTAKARIGIGTAGQVLQVNSGATAPEWAAPAGGKVLQVVSSNITTATVIASTSLTDTGITATITPTASNSKILVVIAANFVGEATVDNTQVSARLFRGATQIQTFDDGAFATMVFGGTTGIFNFNAPIIILDSPATTSATTYKVQARVQSTANSRKVTFQPASTPSTITLMEIGA